MPEKRPMEIADLYRIQYVEQPDVSPDGRWVAYVLRTPDRLEDGYKTNIYVVSTAGGEPIQLTRSGKDSQPQWSPDGSRLAFISGRGDRPQVYALPTQAPGGEPRALTTMEYGVTQFRWSPDGGQIAFLSGLNLEERSAFEEESEEEPPKDQLEAKHRKERKEHEEKLRFEPRPVMRIPYRQGTSYLDDRHWQIFVLDVNEAEAKPRRLTDFDESCFTVAWSPDGQYIYTVRPIEPGLDEPWTEGEVLRITVEDGSITQLTDDETMRNFAPWPSPDGQWVAFVRSGRKMTDDLPVLTIMTPEGGDLRELTREFDRSLDGFDWAADSSRLYLIMGSDGNTELYAVSPEGGPVEKVVEGRFQAYDLKAGPNGVAYVATTPFTSTDLYWFDSDTGETRQLTDVNAGFFDEVLVQETHEIRFEGPGGQEIQGWYILPVGYEEGQQYPLALNIHGGPHVMWGPSEKTMFHEWQIHAASGYVVFYCNPRGSMGYGQAFNNAIHGTWGEVAMPDVMAGVDQMIDMGLVDPARMAVTGGSYGGYLTGWIIGHTDRFAAAVPQRGVYNIASFYGTSDVPLLMSAEFDGEPWEEEAYQRMWHYSPLAHAHKVTTPTLIIHAENDFRVPIEQAEQFFAFIRRATDTPVELWRFPREGHELSRSGAPRLRVGRLEKMIGWFDQYCKG